MKSAKSVAAMRVVAAVGLLAGCAWTATAQACESGSSSAAQPLLNQSTRSGERELILEVPRQDWQGEK
jgi:hypothetical protein